MATNRPSFVKVCDLRTRLHCKNDFELSLTGLKPYHEEIAFERRGPRDRMVQASTAEQRDASTLEPIREKWLDRDQWTPKALGLIGDKIACGLIPQTTEALYRSTKDDVTTIIQSARLQSRSELSEEAAENLHSSRSAMLEFKVGRRSSAGRNAGAEFQRFLNAVQLFVDHFSGIAELVKAADNQYGGLAYGTLSLLLSVAVHKQRREESLEQALEKLTYSFPQLVTLKKLDPSDRLQALIAESFSLVVEFCREAVKYWLNKKDSLMDAVSPSAQKMNTLSQIRLVLSRAREETDLLLLERITKMQERLEDVQRHLLCTQEVVERTSRGDQEINLARLCRILQAKNSCPTDADTKQYDKLLTVAFESRVFDLHSPVQPTWASLMDEQKYADWHHAQSTTILLCGGLNSPFASIKQCGTLNWRSRASVCSVQQLNVREETVLFFYCQNDWTLVQRNRRTFQYVVNSLAYQLAELHPELLPSRLETFESIEQVPKEDQEDPRPDRVLQPLRMLLQALSQHDRVHIVVDRLDQCNWSECRDPFIQNSLPTAVESLVELVREVRCCVKILLIVESFQAQRVIKAEVLKDGKGIVDCKVIWQQETEEESFLKSMRREALI
ncbi:hypothetical protein LTR37_009152 [Vermiconidia calcicola]|uniref:Uncharacterized protein n=1 Tax=Vermiconidia calcicola TaxID=1690605 RepID=A0ACC3N8S2_9PEZI|nr:hypothetical protein LTR37_009152 [Vermiconidia calcicola]